MTRFKMRLVLFSSMLSMVAGDNENYTASDIAEEEDLVQGCGAWDKCDQYQAGAKCLDLDSEEFLEPGQHCKDNSCFCAMGEEEDLVQGCGAWDKCEQYQAGAKCLDVDSEEFLEPGQQCKDNSCFCAMGEEDDLVQGCGAWDKCEQYQAGAKCLDVDSEEFLEPGQHCKDNSCFCAMGQVLPVTGEEHHVVQGCDAWDECEQYRAGAICMDVDSELPLEQGHDCKDDTCICAMDDGFNAVICDSDDDCPPTAACFLLTGSACGQDNCVCTTNAPSKGFRAMVCQTDDDCPAIGRCFNLESSDTTCDDDNCICTGPGRAQMFSAIPCKGNADCPAKTTCFNLVSQDSDCDANDNCICTAEDDVPVEPTFQAIICQSNVECPDGAVCRDLDPLGLDSGNECKDCICMQADPGPPVIDAPVTTTVPAGVVAQMFNAIPCKGNADCPAKATCFNLDSQDSDCDASDNCICTAEDDVTDDTPRTKGEIGDFCQSDDDCRDGVVCFFFVCQPPIAPSSGPSLPIDILPFVPTPGPTSDPSDGTPGLPTNDSPLPGPPGDGPVNGPGDDLLSTLPCFDGIEGGTGVEHNCDLVLPGDTCDARCSDSFEGDEKQYVCQGGSLVPVDGLIKCKRKSCRPDSLPDDPMYDISGCLGTGYDRTCTVRCDVTKGYRPASFSYKCEFSELFVGESQECRKLLCLQRTKPMGPGVNNQACNDKAAGETCQVFCDEGYEGQSETITCDGEGFFQGIAPTCEVAPCDIPDALTSTDNIHHTCGDPDENTVVRHDQSCRAVCNEGFTGGARNWKCFYPTLIGTLPSCKPKECTTNKPGGSGLTPSQCKGKTTGQSCDLSCAYGFEAVKPGSYSVTCQPDGSFTENTLQCQKMACGDLSADASFENTNIDTSQCDDKLHGQSAFTVCARGFESPGPLVSYLKCGAAADYSSAAGFKTLQDSVPKPMTCDGKPCVYGFPTKRGLQHDCDNITTSKTCTVIANAAFQYDSGDLGKDQEWTCGADGEVSGKFPAIVPKTCNVDSSEALSKSGVVHTCDDKTVDTSCWAYCDSKTHDGGLALYNCVLQGKDLKFVAYDSDVSCTATRRRLDPATPSPRSLQNSGKKCNADGLKDIGKAYSNNCDDVDHGGECIIECATGYEISGKSSKRTCNDGDLSGSSSLPTCTAKKCTSNMPSGRGAQHDCTGVTTDSTCTASCEAGYSGKSTTWTCLNTQEVTGTKATCTASKCKAMSLGAAYNGAACSGKTTGEDCIVSCSDGWTLDGEASSYECNANGSFTGTEPKCIPDTCTYGVPSDDDLEIPDKCSKLTTGENCSISCADGYSGSAEVFVCKPSGTVTGSVPTCTAAVCPNTVPSAGGQSSGDCDGTSYLKTCSVGCRSGYSLPDNEALQEWNCTWDSNAKAVSLQGKSPVCDPIVCQYNIPSGNRISHNCTNITMDKTCVAECVAGFSGTVASWPFLCQADKTLSGKQPECDRMKCPSRSESNVVTDCANTTFDNTCLANCADGFVGISEKWTCELDGQSGVELTGKSPVCTGRKCVYNAPPGAYVHDCENRTTAETCTVECDSAKSFAYAPGGSAQIWTCDTEETFQGTSPSCLLITSTLIHTSTAPPQTTSTPTSDSATMELSLEIVGGFALDIPEDEQEAFVNDLEVKAALTDAVSDMSGVPVDYIQVILSIIRRLGARILQSGGGVKVDYTITVPASILGGASVLGVAVPDAETIQNNLASVTMATLQRVVNTKLESVSTNYTAAQVTEWRTPESKMIGRSAETPVPTFTQASGQGSSSGSMGIIGGVIGGVCGVALTAIFVCFIVKRLRGRQNLDLSLPDARLDVRVDQPTTASF